MASRTAGPSRFAIDVAWRAVAVGGLAFCTFYLLSTTQLYATSVIVAVAGAILAADLARVVARADRSFEHFLDGLAAGTSERPARRLTGFGRLAAAMERTARAVDATQAARQQDVAYLQALLDTVPAALLVVKADGLVAVANRAARKLVREPVSRLEDSTTISTAAAKLLTALPAGARQIVLLGDGQQVLAAAAQFSLPGEAPQRLISLQRLTGDLDAVELKAWQDVARVLAHEMMNSLTPIASLSESLEGLLKASAQDAVAIPESAGEFAGAIEAIKRRSLGLMDFIERYRQIAELPAPALAPIRMDAFLSGIDHLMGATFKEKGIAYTSQLAPQALSLTADHRLLEHAVINLLRNATDAVAASESPRITLSCLPADGQYVISVSDNGSGLPESGVDEIFLPFFTTRPGGSGIGLSLARKIALAHGGQVRAERNQPRGAVFSLRLPLRS